MRAAPIAAALLAVPAGALAEPARTVESVVPAIAPVARGVVLEARADLTHIDGSNERFIGLRLRAQYLGARGLGVYTSLPFGVVGGGDDDATTALGNLEAGAMLAGPVTRNLTVYARAGAALETDGDFDNAAVAPVTSFTPIPLDSSAAGLDTSWLRAAAGGRLRSGEAVLGGHVGIDVPLGDPSTLVGLAVAAGWDASDFGAAAALTIVHPLEGQATAGLHLLADLPTGPARIFGAVAMSLDTEVRGYSIGFGVRLAP